MSPIPGVIVQNSIGGTAGPSQTATYSCTASSTLVAIVSGPSGTSHTITDNINGSSGWNLMIALTTVGGGGIKIYYRDTMAAGSTIVTDTFGASTAFTGIALFEVTGTAGFDVSSVINVQTSGTTRTSATATPTVTGAAVGFCYEDTQNNSITVDTGSSWAALTGTGVTAGKFWNFGGGSIFALLETKAYATTAALAATITAVNTGSTTGTAVMMFKDASANLTLALTGVGANGVAGNVSQTGGTTPPQNVGFIPRPILGLNGPIALSAFSRPPRSYLTVQTPDLTLALTGVAALAALGSVSAQRTMALSGIAATGAVGTVTASGASDITLSLTGVAAATALGALAPSLSLAMTGNSAVGAVGTVTSSGSNGNLTLALIGVGAIGVVGFLTASGGSPISTGAVRTIFLSDVTPVPATAVFIAGTAFAQTGEMYVCPYPSIGITGIRHRGPFADRKDGARVISSVGVEFNRVQGISFTSLNEMLVTLNQYDVVLSGVPLTSAGFVSVTAVS